MYFNYGQFLSIEYQIETVLENARYCLIEPLTLGLFPFVGGDSLRSGRTRECGLHDDATGEMSGFEVKICAVTLESTDAGVRTAIKVLASETVNMHRVAVWCLHKLSIYNKDGRRHTEWVCRECCDEVARMRKTVAAQNCILGRFLEEVLSMEHREPNIAAGLSRRPSCHYRHRHRPGVAGFRDRVVVGFERQVRSQADLSARWRKAGGSV